MDTKPAVLVLDDNDEMRLVLSDILDSNGFRTIGAEDGRRALDLIEREHPPVGIIDLMLPDTNGLEVIAEINKRYPDIECIVLTAYASQESAIKAVSLGAYGYIQKPYDVEQLVLTIRRAFEKHESDMAFRASEEKYRTLFENAHDALIVVQMDSWTILDANREAERLLGCRRSELVGTQFSKLYPVERKESYDREFGQYIRSRQKTDFEAELVSKECDAVPVHMRAVVIELWGGKAVHVIIRDITERKKAEGSLLKRASDVKHISELMIDNEMRMLEMKKEVDALLHRIGSPPRYTERD